MATDHEYKTHIVRASVIPTTSYVAGTVIEKTRDNNQLNVYVSLTFGSLTSAEVKVEFSADGTTYYQETFSAVSTVTSTESLGEHKFGAGGNYRLEIPLKDNFVKISAKGTGTLTNSLMAISAVLGQT